MARRPPATEQEYREALKLLEAGHKQTGPDSVAELLEIPDGTIGRWATEWKAAGILRPDGSVDWEPFNAWVLKKAAPSRQPKSPRKPTPEGPQLPTVDSPQEPMPTAHTLAEDETQALKELIIWWQSQKAHAERPRLPTVEGPQEPTVESPRLPTLEGPRTRRHLLIHDDLWKQARREAKRQGRSIGDLVNEAIQRYLE